jgi:hypothetical protein
MMKNTEGVVLSFELRVLSYTQLKIRNSKLKTAFGQIIYVLVK